MKENIAIIGGGLAGISAAVNICKQVNVHLFEASPHLGGRVRSFYDKDFECELDNGMHLMIGAYTETFSLLKILGSIDHVKFLPLDIPFYFPGQDDKGFRLKSNKFIPGALHLLFSLLKANILSSRELLGLIKLSRIRNPEKMNLTCSELLRNYGQTEKSIENFWRPLILATLNTEPEIAHAENLLAVLRLGFFKGKRASRLVFPNKPFSEVFGNPAHDYLFNNDVKIELGKPIRKITREDENYWLDTSKEKYGPYKAIISALPKTDLDRILDVNEDSFEYSPITSFYFKISGSGLPAWPINAILESKLHWLFYLSHRNIFSVTSSTKELKWELEEFADELKRIFPGNWHITHFKRIITKKATPIFTPDNKDLRKAASGNKEIFIAGDWTDTGLPATIEGAVISGKKAAEELLKMIID